MKKIAIRADGHSEIGFGHLMRCLNLAKLLRTEYEITFISFCEKESIVKEIQSLGFQMLALTRQEAIGIQTDRAKTLELASGISDLQLLILDSYSYSFADQKFLRDGLGAIALVLIDDIGDREFCCDAIINQNFGASAELYGDFKGSVFAGSDYWLKRAELNSLKLTARYQNQKVQNVLLTLGGAPTEQELTPFLAAFNDQQFSHLNFTVLCGGLDTSKLRQQCGSNVELISFTNDIITKVSQSDVCICAGGTTLYEILYVGRAALVCSLVDNQSLSINNVTGAGLAIKVDHNPEMIKNSLLQLIQDGELRESLIAAQRKTFQDAGLNLARFNELFIQICPEN
jgi:UDP-2,4-diacetamido-2,4,6-trideoxy-beta-L-altropyranose hydrolase